MREVIKPFAVACMFFLLTACASLGLVEPKSFDQRLAYAYGNVTALRSSTVQSLGNETIGSADSEYVLRITDQTRSLLDAAQTVAISGDATAAQDRLTVALAVMAELQKYLAKRGK